jgi:tRNA threonylcarbamoyladenosine biosynthesis protein TsaE
MNYTFQTHSKVETHKLGQRIAPYFKAGDVVLLKGDLGAGKTTLVGGVADALKCQEDVISPTFNIMKCYFKGTLPLYHIDAYRLENQNIELGLDEFIEGNGVCFIEWPMYVQKLLPPECLEIVIKNVGGDNREITMTSPNAHFDEIVSSVKEAF